MAILYHLVSAGMKPPLDLGRNSPRPSAVNIVACVALTCVNRRRQRIAGHGRTGTRCLGDALGARYADQIKKLVETYLSYSSFRYGFAARSTHAHHKD